MEIGKLNISCYCTASCSLALNYSPSRHSLAGWRGHHGSPEAFPYPSARSCSLVLVLVSERGRGWVVAVLSPQLCPPEGVREPPQQWMGSGGDTGAAAGSEPGAEQSPGGPGAETQPWGVPNSQGQRQPHPLGAPRPLGSPFLGWQRALPGLLCASPGCNLAHGVLSRGSGPWFAPPAMAPSWGIVAKALFGDLKGCRRGAELGPGVRTEEQSWWQGAAAPPGWLQHPRGSHGLCPGAPQRVGVRVPPPCLLLSSPCLLSPAAAPVSRSPLACFSIPAADTS